jgi:hypothetical protein
VGHGLDAGRVDLVDLLDVVEDRREFASEFLESVFRERKAREAGALLDVIDREGGVGHR